MARKAFHQFTSDPVKVVAKFSFLSLVYGKQLCRTM